VLAETLNNENKENRIITFNDQREEHNLNIDIMLQKISFNDILESITDLII